MATRQLHRLTALKIGKLDAPGHYPDGGNLYFQISETGSRSWIFKFTLRGKSREMGLGPLSSVSLAAARVEAAKCRNLLREGLDPIEVRKAEQNKRVQEASGPRLFRAAAAAYIAQHRDGWKNKKHAQQWENTLATYANQILGDQDVRDVDTAMIVSVLQPIWISKRETAFRLRGRLECILDAEKALGHREGENPARWRGHLDKLLPKQNRRKKIKHHPALPWQEMPEFMKALREQRGTAARMLEHLILTVVRTQEVQFARPEEFAMGYRIWTVPGERMKMELPLRVPMVDRLVELVKEALPDARDGWLYPGRVKNKPLSNMAMLKVLERMGYDHITVHGFRSTFRDWVAECTEYADSLAEKALAHAIQNESEAAYRRGDMLERRRKMMSDWARFCSGETAAIISISPMGNAPLSAHG
ncbi:site-specific integrase [Ralstonia pickettii]|jgi:integrase|uniref:tyrosine-type recombinase/integrase n=1 Tax=Ralstonia pickettii TaxID=329 RepID=UPI0015FE4360|nr:site-specific integrase [Ralstonia pickettii]MBB0022948.1 site-specific integrase [Ralstonia pickettii]MBB0033505.1 site-specific integrase [Ralstonia pickettii]MBB0095966.1 site-specific integrase [Ralstonia pickettii]MBB0105973.1 site-specific integrase [Ralstonia pickettii]MBB0127617.1 site-specific integrase [Ralstonia pickettii]